MKYLTICLFLASIVSICILKKKELNFEKDTGISFNILAFEYPKNVYELNSLIEKFKAPNKTHFLTNQLSLDYIFMACIYPFIFSLCFLGIENLALITPKVSKKRKSKLIKILTILASLQLLAWLMDYCENARLEKWIELGSVDNFILFKFMVVLKFMIAVSGFILGLVVFIYTTLKRYKNKNSSLLTAIC